MWRKVLKVVAGLVVAGTVGIAFLFWFLFVRTPSEFEPTDFNAHTWRTSPATYSFESPRLRMVNDLLDTHELVGRTRSEVTSLLGEPDDTLYFRNYDLVYCLGKERISMALDSEWLVFKLGSDGRVRTARVVRD